MVPATIIRQYAAAENTGWGTQDGIGGSAATRRMLRLFFAASCCLGVHIEAAEAATSTGIDTGSTAWVLMASALVLFMTLPGLALFYGGLVRARNLLSVLMHCFVVSCIVSLLWVAFGYSLVFDRGNALIGSLDAAFLNNVSGHLHPNGVPETAFALFQMTFAIITPALIVGAFTERAKFSFVLSFRHCGSWWFTCRSRIGCGAAAFSPHSVRSTSPAALSCTPRQACPPSLRRR